MFDLTHILKNIGLFAALIFAALLLTPPGLGLGAYKIPADEIVYRVADEKIPYTRFNVSPSEGTLKQQFQHRQAKTRRFHFKFDEAYPVDGPRTLYIPSAGGAFRPSINGGYMGLGTPHDFFAPGFGSHWSVDVIPRYFLLPGQNRLDIFLTEDPTRSGIREIYFGPNDKMQTAVKQQQIWMNTLPKAVRIGYGICIIILVGGIFFGVRSASFIIMGFLSLLLFLPGIFPLIRETVFVTNYGDLIRFVLPIVAVLGVIVTFVTRENKWRAVGGFYPALNAFAVIGPLLAITLMFTPLFIDAQFLIVTLALLGALPLILVTGSQDMFSGLVNRRSRIEELTLKVSEQSEELDEKTKLIVKEMRQRALMEERQRFTRDIHDGIGGKLLSLLLQVRSGEMNRDVIAEEIQWGIRDLRMVVDSIDHMGEDLDAIFQTFKTRAQPQMTAAKLELNWQQADRIYGSIINEGGGALHLYRLMQEALTNIVRHAKASKVDFIISQPADLSRLDVFIRDNGIGLPDSAFDGPGNGLKNMRERARALGGKLNIEAIADENGTQLSLSIPLMKQA